MRRLEGPEIESYDVLSPELAERVRIVQVPVLPTGSSGMTIGRFVFLKSDDDHSGNRKLLAHELIHVSAMARSRLVDIPTLVSGRLLP